MAVESDYQDKMNFRKAETNPTYSSAFLGAFRAQPKSNQSFKSPSNS